MSGGDESSGEWNFSHTLQFTRRQFPGRLAYTTILEKRVLVTQKLKRIYKRLKCQL